MRGEEMVKEFCFVFLFLPLFLFAFFEMVEIDQEPKQSDAPSSPEKSALLKSRGDAVASADNT